MGNGTPYGSYPGHYPVDSRHYGNTEVMVREALNGAEAIWFGQGRA